ncbi:3-methyladenine DNA glycosylase, partial [Pseudomonas syringae pv. tagetis]
FDPHRLLVEDMGLTPDRIIHTTRLGIPVGRDEHLMYRFVDGGYARFCTRNPLSRGQVEGRDYLLLDQGY